MNGRQRIYTDDHTERAHVHVFRAGTFAVIDLPAKGAGVELHRVERMSRANIRRALEIVATNAEYLQQRWDGYHGEKSDEAPERPA